VGTEKAKSSNDLRKVESSNEVSYRYMLNVKVSGLCSLPPIALLSTLACCIGHLRAIVNASIETDNPFQW
jgi:hypothetical protein